MADFVTYAKSNTHTRYIRTVHIHLLTLYLVYRVLVISFTCLIFLSFFSHSLAPLSYMRYSRAASLFRAQTIHRPLLLLFFKCFVVSYPMFRCCIFCVCYCCCCCCYCGQNSCLYMKHFGCTVSNVTCVKQ